MNSAPLTKGLRLLKEGGRLGYISSNTFFKTGSGKPLRQYLGREATLESVVDFGDLQVFEGVTTYPAILTMRRGTAPKGHEMQFWKVDALTGENFLARWENAQGPYPQQALGAGSWELENPALRALRDKIRKGRKTLKEVYGSPMRGVGTGLNAAFTIDSETKEKICAADPKSIELLRPFLEGKDLKRWRAEPRGLWIIYIPKNKIDIKDYPAIEGHLLPFKERLEKRATKQEWFELQQPQEAYVPKFLSPKVIYNRFTDKPNFAFVEEAIFTNDAPYFVSTKDASLAALLNSKVYWLLLVTGATALRGGFVQLLGRYIEPMPIPKITNPQKSALVAKVSKIQMFAQNTLKLQTALTRRIPDLCPPDRDPKLTNKLKEWWTLPDFAAFRAEIKKTYKTDIPLSERSDWEDWISRDRAEIARLTAEITQTEAQIDSIVYDLFDLTPDEIALLEASI